MIKQYNKNSRSFVTGIDNSFICNNSIMLTVGEIGKFQDSIPSIGKNQGSNRLIFRVKEDDNDWFRLNKGSYKIITEQSCQIADNECGMIVPNRNFSRQGLFVSNDIYESGYSGQISFSLYIDTMIDIEKGVSIAKFLFFGVENNLASIQESFFF